MDTHLAQPAILAPIAKFGRGLSFRLNPDTGPRATLSRLRKGWLPDWGAIGIGEPLARALGADIPGLRPFPLLDASSRIPATQHALWIFLSAPDRSAIFDRTQAVRPLTEGGFAIEDVVDTFRYADGRDLTGYEDGTENPKGDAAVEVALIDEGAGLAGSSLVAVQRWEHDLARFNTFSRAERDGIIGRNRDSNEELADAPPSAHVRRSAQEDFDPPAFMLRRSMPWSTGTSQGFEFIAYGRSLDPFERVLRRMAGLEDGIVDGLFRFSRPLTGAYYWCPPIAEGRLDLSFAGL